MVMARSRSWSSALGALSVTFSFAVVYSRPMMGFTSKYSRWLMEAPRLSGLLLSAFQLAVDMAGSPSCSRKRCVSAS